MTIRERTLFILLFFIGILGVFYFKGVSEEEKAVRVREAEDQRYKTTFGKVQIRAKAAYVYDLTEGKVLYAKQENVELPLASLTKAMTALTALRERPGMSGMSIASAALAEEGDSGLTAGERWRLGDLTEFMLVSSSNDAASAIAIAGGNGDAGVFVTRMNALAQSMELHRTSFINPTGLDTPDLSATGGTGTAKEITKIFVTLLQEFPEVFPETAAPRATFVSLDGTAHTVKNTNTVTGMIPGLVASKTGFTDLAGGNLIVVASVGLQHPIAITVLGSTADGRFTDVETLLAAAIRYIAWNSGADSL